MIKPYKDRILAALPGTYAELSKKAHAGYACVTLWMKKLHGTEVHVGAWKRTEGHGGKQQPVWHAGPGEDAPKLPPRTRAEISRQYIAKLKKDGRFLQYRQKQSKNARRRAMEKKACAGLFNDPIITALHRRPE